MQALPGALQTKVRSHVALVNADTASSVLSLLQRELQCMAKSTVLPVAAATMHLQREPLPDLALQ